MAGLICQQVYIQRCLPSGALSFASPQFGPSLLSTPLSACLCFCLHLYSSTNILRIPLRDKTWIPALAGLYHPRPQGSLYIHHAILYFFIQFFLFTADVLNPCSLQDSGQLKLGLGFISSMTSKTTNVDKYFQIDGWLFSRISGLSCFLAWLICVPMNS